MAEDNNKTNPPKVLGNKKKKEEDSPLKKNLGLLLKIIEAPLFIGILITCVFLFLASTFYHIRGLNEINSEVSGFTRNIFKAVEGLDFLLTDMRFILRGEKVSDTKVALIAIDDRSVEEIGRWPWSREKMAQLIENLFGNGAKSLGIDIVFSEPQDSPIRDTLAAIETKANLPANLQELFDAEKSKPTPDEILATTLSKYQDKIVLGVFENSNDPQGFRPFQDYCLNEAFSTINASQFVKIENVSFVVEDRADPYEQLDFSNLFRPLFKAIQGRAQDSALIKEFQASTPEELTTYEQRKLKYLLDQSIIEFCRKWLDPEQDETYQTSVAFFESLLETQPEFKGLTAEAAIAKFEKSVLSHPVRQSEGWTINLEKLHNAATYSASFAAQQDTDGAIRVNPLFYRTGNRIGTSFIPAMALQTYLVANPGYQASVAIDVDPQQPTQKIINSFIISDTETQKEVMRIPVDGQGRLKINYAGGRNMYPYVPAKELLNNNPKMKITVSELHPQLKRYIPKEVEVSKAEFIKDRSFLIGATAVGIYDLRVTPFDKNYPGPETHMTVLANLFDKNFIRVDPDESTKMLWVLLVAGILLSAAVAYAGAVLGFVITLSFEGFLVFLDQYLLKQGLVTTMILPALLGGSIYILLTLYKYFTEERKKKYLRSTFSKYVSPAVVDEILKDPENIELGGKKQRMTVMFSDVRGFTTISEKLEPQVLSDVLNHYLTPMTQIVFENKGTLDKYMGDAIMSFFGAPIAFPDHAHHACRCALQSLVKLAEIQSEFHAAGHPSIDIGIGINSGDMSVGNMGSDIVRSYTVMGDSVNLGSRLEGINKEYGTRIIISEFTYKDVQNEFVCREVDRVRVKGKLEPVRIFELIAEGAVPADWKDCLQFFNAGYQFYHAKNFLAAKEQFESALSARPTDPVAELYIERCADYIAEAPPEHWDGVHVMKTK